MSFHHYQSGWYGYYIWRTLVHQARSFDQTHLLHVLLVNGNKINIFCHWCRKIEYEWQNFSI